MILIIESGASNIKAMVLDKSRNRKQIWTDLGLNVKTSEKDYNFLRKIEPALAVDVVQCHFYGAGLTDESEQNRIKAILDQHLPNLKQCFIKSDMDALLDVFDDDEYIAVILGTGSHFKQVKNGRIISTNVAGGYLLGDEGSGFHIGTTICSDFINRNMSKEDHYSFLMSYQTTPQKFVNALYEQDDKKRYVASFATFLQIASPNYKGRILHRVFSDLAHKIIKSIPSASSLKCNFVGSVAYHFKDILTEEFSRCGLTVGQIEISALKLLSQKIDIV